MNEDLLDVGALAELLKLKTKRAARYKMASGRWPIYRDRDNPRKRYVLRSDVLASMLSPEATAREQASHVLSKILAPYR